MARQAVGFKGFTLVEMLVAIAIIALLISILIPTLNAAREQSRFVACKANLREIGVQLQAYEIENDGEIPRGPFYDGALTGLPLFARDIATSQLWMGGAFNVDERMWPPQYIGMGLLTRQPGRTGNEFFFCPADDKHNIVEEASKIGREGTGVFDFSAQAFGSYVYRQADALPDHLNERSIKLDELGFNEFDTTVGTPINPPDTYRVEVAAMALDVNTLGTGDCRQSNHQGKRLNVLYVDGAVQGFDNEPQYTSMIASVPWGSIPASAFDADCTPLSPITETNLDRIFVAADLSYRSEKPWEAPVPPPE